MIGGKSEELENVVGKWKEDRNLIDFVRISKLDTDDKENEDIYG